MTARDLISLQEKLKQQQNHIMECVKRHSNLEGEALKNALGRPYLDFIRDIAEYRRIFDSLTPEDKVLFYTLRNQNDSHTKSASVL